MRHLSRGFELGDIAPIRGQLVPVSSTALDLTRGEFSIGRGARPFISPRNLIWKGLPGEETQISRLYFAKSDMYEASAPAADVNSTGITSDVQYTWSAYLLHAMRDAKRWLSSSGVWGGREYMGLMGLVGIIDEWIVQQTQIVTLVARQIKATPSGSFPTQIRSVEHWENYAIIPHANSSGMLVRWPLEVYALSKSLLYELKWARYALFGLANTIKGFVDCTKTNADGICTEVIATSGTFAAAQAYEDYKYAMAYLSGSPGLPIQIAPGEWRAPEIGETFPLFGEVINYIGEISGLMQQYRDLQEIVVSTVKQVIDEIAAGVRGGINEIQNFAGTVAEVGAAIPIMGLFIQVVGSLVVIALDNARIDAARRRERGLPHLYRGVQPDGETPTELARSDIETWALMMYRTMKLQETRIFALVDGTSPLLGALRPLAPGVATYPTILLPNRFTVRQPGAGTAKVLSQTTKTALAVGGGVSALGLVWWLWRRFS